MEFRGNRLPLLLLCALALLAHCCHCSSVLGTRIASLNGGNRQQLVRFKADSSGISQAVADLSEAGALLPDCMTPLWTADSSDSSDSASSERLTMCSLSLDSAAELLTTVDAVSGKKVAQWSYERLVVDNIAYDAQQKKMYINGFNETMRQNVIFEVNTSNGKLTPVVAVPGIVQVDISAYSSKKHQFYLTEQLRESTGLGNSLVVVDTASRKVVSNSTVGPGALEVLLYDDSEETLYGFWATQQFGAQLITIDPVTGKVLKKIWSSTSLSANGGAAAYDAASSTMYASLFNYKEDNSPAWVTIDTKTGKSTSTSIANNEYPWAINLAFDPSN